MNHEANNKSVFFLLFFFNHPVELISSHGQRHINQMKRIHNMKNGENMTVS